MLLARTADRLLWGARYLERAEDTARAVRAYGDLVFDYSDEMLSWEPLAAMTGGDGAEAVGEREVLTYMLADRANPSSIVSSALAARSNLRTTREVLPREAWQAANQLSQYVQATCSGAVERNLRDGFLLRVIEISRRFDGSVDAAMTRAHPYRMLRIGRLLERADMTTRVLGVAAANALRSERTRRASGAREDVAIDEVVWMGVLRSVAALQMYQRATRGPISGIAVVNFLMTYRTFPRSVQGCFDELRVLLTALPNPAGPLERLRVAESLLEASGHEVVEGAALDRAMEGIQGAIADVAAAIHHTYVGSLLDAPPDDDPGAPGGADRLAVSPDA